MRRRSVLMLASAALALPALPPPARAQTVDELVRRGGVRIGMLVDLPPYGTLNDQQQPDGYDADVARLLGRYLGVAVEIVPLTTPNRIPFLLSGKVDLLVATFGVTPERARQVEFSIPYSALAIAVFAPRDRHLAALGDLRGLRVGVPRGGVQDVMLSEQPDLGARVVRFDDTAGTFQAMLSGQVDAIAQTAVTGDAIFAANPGAGIERKFTLLTQFNGISLRPGQRNLRQWVDTFVYYVKNNGELDALHRKWFGEKLPALPVF